MKKTITLVILLFTAYIPCFALHIAGGELFYRYVGPGTKPGTDKYSVTLRLFRECNPVVPPGTNGAALMPGEVELGFFTNSDAEGHGVLLMSEIVDQTEYDEITLRSPLVCIVNPPKICYQIGYFTKVVDLPQSKYGYTVAYQTCCRSFSILNIQFHPIPGQQAPGEGATYACVIPGTDILGPDEKNTSAMFGVKDTVLVCQNKKIKLDFSATDGDSENPLYGDSLSYSFCNAYDRGSAASSGNVTPSAPPYQSVGYTGGYAGEFPLGSNVVIDPKTGIITGTIGSAGGYVVNVCVYEWRHGKVISIHRKDFLLRVAACDFAAADLNPTYISCDGFDLTFKNESTSSAIHSYFWQFDINNPADTSTKPTPLHVYKDTGAYTVRLVVNKGEECSDSALTIARVYPGFFPDFSVKGNCIQTPYLFIDQSTTKYGQVDSWRWDFGDGDTSILQNPQHLYNSTGTKDVTLTVGSNKGCEKIINNPLAVKDKPDIAMRFKDTLICNVDTLQLAASTDFPGKYAWSPGVNMIDPTSKTPLVYPRKTQVYYVLFDDGKGCVNTDSVNVNVVDSAIVHLGRDTIICLGDTTQLISSTNALYFKWLPATHISSDNVASPFVSPLDSTRYVVVASISKYCMATDDIIVKEIPYPQANAGPPVSVCYGKTVQLSATIKASTFTWSPASSLVNPNTLTPIAGPQATTTYQLLVYDTINKPNCPKPVYSLVTVTVIPPVPANAGRDTTVVVGQPLQLNATGGSIYTWQPTTALNNPNISNPVATYNPGLAFYTYKVKVQTADGCVGYDDINVKVFQTFPDIFVPTAFSPNADGHNDVLKAIAVGLKQFNYLRIYNRWGNMVFSSGNTNDGWDGTFGGRKQASGSYVFVTEGIDYRNKPIMRKGTVVLIR